ncbi:MAG: DUF3034 family protein [Alphaproteobacteria bacterium]|nr:DUF3034 family protein [Alphaproteobacteria bacterium]MDE1987633.1 DUF3034 family protein [Alphaproteobacteria bacterium]MDE2266219.1 DUF3034 family protein [Alphaproteobacteria bacterium]MDE2499450.1 DUF3034 family protein [Alphaproteobacteria bacterium]
MRIVFATALAVAATFCAATAQGEQSNSVWDQGQALFDEGRLLATGGVSNVEGAGGGGLASWALITGYGTRDGVGLNAHFTYVNLPDYALWSPGVAVGLYNRLELSYAHQTFDTEDVGTALGLGKNYEFHQDVYGAKLRLFGNVVYDQDTLLPEVAVGVQVKNNDRGAVIKAIGGGSASGTDFYIAASKLFLAQSLLVNATLRETKANQFGILGFGGDRHGGASTQFEGSAAYLLSRKFVIGAEYRSKPNNLTIARETSAWDLFAAYFLDKNVSLTAAYVDLGNIVIRDHQHGVYVSLQVGI